ncbi:MAG: hypothetical protein IIA67_11175 [Planctomycetes bacterium]|nr:hypothetical protein [Planctomycetota bacterium]
MAENKDPTESTQDESPQEPKAPQRKKLWSRLANRRTLAAILAASVIAHGVGFIYYNKLRHIIVQSPEVGLGEFEFEGVDTRLSPVTRATFSLHVSLLSDIEPRARTRLYTRRFRVQQDIEQLLRESQGGDFEDPKLDEIKNRIQEQINITLDMRAIEQVIVTDLAVTRVGKNAPLTPAATAGATDSREGTTPSASGAIAGNGPKDGPAGDSPWETTPPQ